MNYRNILRANKLVGSSQTRDSKGQQELSLASSLIGAWSFRAPSKDAQRNHMKKKSIEGKREKKSKQKSKQAMAP